MEKELDSHKEFAEKTAVQRKIIKYGNSLYISIPENFLATLGLNEGDEGTVMFDVNKKGQKYVAVFKT